jgi:hypothetical protein
MRPAGQPRSWLLGLKGAARTSRLQVAAATREQHRRSRALTVAYRRRPLEHRCCLSWRGALSLNAGRTGPRRSVAATSENFPSDPAVSRAR